MIGNKTRVRVHSSNESTFEVELHEDGQCRSCDAFIVWCRTRPDQPGQGKRMPLDARPDKEGVYTSHFATCPEAEKWRQK